MYGIVQFDVEFIVQGLCKVNKTLSKLFCKYVIL